MAPSRCCYLPLGFVGFLGGGIVSTVVVFGRRFASSIGINSPVFESLPRLLTMCCS
jgi:hypothetical protein